jgi:hypothetical protein
MFVVHDRRRSRYLSYLPRIYISHVPWKVSAAQVRTEPPLLPMQEAVSFVTAKKHNVTAVPIGGTKT